MTDGRGLLRRVTRQRPADLSFSEPLERPVAELPHPLTRYAEHPADLLESVLLAAIEAEVESEHLRIAGRQ